MQMRFPIIVRRFNRFARLFGDLAAPGDPPQLMIPVRRMIDGHPLDVVIYVRVGEERTAKFADAAEIAVIFLFQKPVYAYVTKRKA